MKHTKQQCFVLDDAQGVHNRWVTWKDGEHDWLKCVQNWENIAHAYGLPKVLILSKKHLNMLEEN
jgi:hypothetical protein